jgi:hypothetical protein
MLGICAAFLEYSDFSPTEAVFCSQLVLPSQYVDDTTESPSPSFLEELQNTTAGHSPPPVPHNFSLATSTFPEGLLLAHFVAGPTLLLTIPHFGVVYILFPLAHRGPD